LRLTLDVVVVVRFVATTSSTDRSAVEIEVALRHVKMSVDFLFHLELKRSAFPAAEHIVLTSNRPDGARPFALAAKGF